MGKCPRCGKGPVEEVFVIGSKYNSSKSSRFRQFCVKCGWSVINNVEWTPEEHRMYDAIGITAAILGFIFLILGYGLEVEYSFRDLLRVFGILFFLGGIFLWRAPYTIRL
jgi:hypothetical protein